MKTVWSLVVASVVGLSLGPFASAVVATDGCSDVTLTTTTTTFSQNEDATLRVVRAAVAVRTITTCAETLTLDPASAAPSSSVTATLTGAQPQIRTVTTITTSTTRAIPHYDANGTRDGYTYETETDTITEIQIETNTAIIRFDGVQVGVATLSASGLRTTFTVPNVLPGAHTVTATPTAGTVATASLSVLDTIPPFISGVSAPPPNAAGWNGGDVIVQFVCADADSAIQSCTAPVTLNTDGAGQSVTGTAVDAAGNTATFVVSGINIDKTSPTIEPHASRPPDHGSWYTAPVTITFDCEDALSGIATCTAAITLSDDGRQLYTAEAFDKAGNGLEFAGTVNIDTTPPTITAPPDVTISTIRGSCIASPALGTPIAADNLGTVSVTNDAPSSFPKGTTTVLWTATDPAGHTATAAQHVTVNDTEAPSIVPPANVRATATGPGGVFIATSAIGTAAVADNCPGTVTTSVRGIPAGNVFPLGVTVLTWTATDASLNATTATQTVTVAYNLCLLYDPTRAVKLGSTIPIKLQLCAADGTNMSSASAVPHATTLVRTGTATTSVADDSGNANPDSDFRYDATLGGTGGYIYNLSTKNLTAGAWQMQFTLNGVTYGAAFQVK